MDLTSTQVQTLKTIRDYGKNYYRVRNGWAIRGAATRISHKTIDILRGKGLVNVTYYMGRPSLVLTRAAHIELSERRKR